MHVRFLNYTKSLLEGMRNRADDFLSLIYVHTLCMVLKICLQDIKGWRTGAYWFWKYLGWWWTKEILVIVQFWWVCGHISLKRWNGHAGSFELLLLKYVPTSWHLYSFELRNLPEPEHSCVCFFPQILKLGCCFKMIISLLSQTCPLSRCCCSTLYLE